MYSKPSETPLRPRRQGDAVSGSADVPGGESAALGRVASLWYVHASRPTVGSAIDLPAVFTRITGMGDQGPPVIEVALQNDTGVDGSDGITSDPTIAGTISDEGQIASFLMGIDGSPTIDLLELFKYFLFFKA